MKREAAILQFHLHRLALAAVILGLSALAACSTAPQRPQQWQEGDYRYTAEYLSWMIRAQMRRTPVKGLSIALVDDQKIVWAQGFGHADVANKVPATAETVYRIGSITKVVTATAVMKLAETGKIDIDQPLNHYLPDFSIRNRFPDAPPITLRAMLAHHSGLPSDYLKGMWVEQPVSLARLAAELREESLVSPPQTMYKYSNLDFSLLGRVVEVATGKDFSSAVRQDLLEPLGMTHSSFSLTPETRRLASKAYRNGGEVPVPTLRDIPAGSMLSNVIDMGRFVKFIFADGSVEGRQMVQARTLARMFEVQYKGLPLDFGHEMGLAWMLNGIDVPGAQAVVWHYGGYPPFFASLLLLPKQKLGVIVLSNSEEAKAFTGQLAAKALELALASKSGVPPPAAAAPPKVKAAPVPAETLDRYTGDYVILGRKSQIRRSGSKLKIELQGNELDLLPMAPNRFFPQKTLLGLISIPIYNLSVQFMNVAGMDVALLRGLPAPLPFQKIRPYSIPASWAQRLGDYRGESGDEEVEFNRFSLVDNDGYLTAHIAVSSKIFQTDTVEDRIVLKPLSDTEAAVMGLGNGEGGVLRVIQEQGQEKLLYSGYRFTRLKP